MRAYPTSSLFFLCVCTTQHHLRICCCSTGRIYACIPCVPDRWEYAWNGHIHPFILLLFENVKSAFVQLKFGLFCKWFNKRTATKMQKEDEEEELSRMRNFIFFFVYFPMQTYFYSFFYGVRCFCCMSENPKLFRFYCKFWVMTLLSSGASWCISNSTNTHMRNEQFAKFKAKQIQKSHTRTQACCKCES